MTRVVAEAVYNGARSKTDPIAPYGGINLDTIQDVVIATFYQFTPLPDKDVVRKTLPEKCARVGHQGDRIAGKRRAKCHRFWHAPRH
ncbi:MAG UNVERIFIED_CONTAM: hypothetical protein LVT10_16095 [Anaerolineae bacterium]|jgi:hypothetical protein